MPRPTTGQVITTGQGDDLRFAVRFRAYGQRRYVTLGRAGDGWTRAKAERELRGILADVERGIWQPARPEAPAVPEMREMPSFHVFASEWFEARKGEWSERGAASYRALLASHLLPFFADFPLDAIRAADVDRYTERKLAEGSIGPTTINKTVTLLGQILARAEDYELIASNAVRRNAKARRLKSSPMRRPWLDRAEHIAALLDAAGAMDAGAPENKRHIPRRAWLSTLVFSGLRPSEALRLRWRDVDFAGGRLHVPRGKTQAAHRDVPMLTPLHRELAGLRPLDADPDALVFATPTGNALSERNLRGRIFDAAVERANAQLVEAGYVPLPEGLSPYGLRHTYVSLLGALGLDLATIGRQAGHASPSTTMRVYLHAMALDEGARERLLALVEGRPLEAPEEAPERPEKTLQRQALGSHWAALPNQLRVAGSS